jgi:hypothetical protein
MRKITLILAFFSIFSLLLNGQIENNSYVNSSGEKVLRFSFIVPLEKKQAWEYFTVDEKLATWISPVVHIDLKCGGYMVTNYDKNKSLSDSTSIRLGIPAYLQDEMLILKVELNNFFTRKVQEEDTNLQEVIQFESVAQGKTKITSSMIGWGMGEDWDKTYDFFAKGNEWSYQQLLKIFQ